MLVISLLTVGDVLLRFFLNAPITGFYEVVEIIIAVAIAASFPAGLAQRRVLRVEFLERFLSVRLRSILQAVGSAALLLFIVVITWRLGVYATVLQARSEATVIIELPTAPFWWAATFFVGLCIPVQVVKTLIDIRRMLAELQAEPTIGRDVATTSPAAIVVAISTAAIGVCALAVAALADATTPMLLGAIGFVMLWAMIILMVPIGVARWLIGVGGAALILGLEPTLDTSTIRGAGFLANLNLAVLPLFIMMGSFAAAAGLSGDMFRLAQTTLGGRRGGLAMAAIGGCAGFGAVTGSSLATAATIGRVALPEMESRGYAQNLAAGSVAAGGVLGQLIPPSNALIIFAVLTGASIGQLFIAAIIPAALTTLMYLGTLSVYVRMRPDSAPSTERKAPWAQKWNALKGSWGVLVLFGGVMGGIYGGIFTATEAAAVGAGAAFVFALVRRRLREGAFWRVMGETAANTVLIYLLIFGAVAFSLFIGVSELPIWLVENAQSLDAPPLLILLCILVIYLLLGSILDPVTIMLLTVPVVAPLVQSLGYDLVWWGILTVAVVEVGQITPPLGMNVFVIRGVAPHIPLTTIFRGIIPFFCADIVRIALLLLFPIITLWLPAAMQ